MRKISNFSQKIALFLAILAGVVIQCYGQDSINREYSFEKNGWGIAISEEVSIETDSEDMSDYFSNYISNKKHYVSRSDVRSKFNAPGITLHYLWHPFMRRNTASWVDRLFVKPEVGGQIEVQSTRTEWTKFLFTANVLFGYTIKIRNFGFDIYTGPAAKIATKHYTRNNYTGENNNWPIKLDEISYTYDYTPWCVSWRFGFALNYTHFGLTISYNQPMGYYMRETIRDTGQAGNPIIGKNNRRQLKYLSFGLSYKF